MWIDRGKRETERAACQRKIFVYSKIGCQTIKESKGFCKTLNITNSLKIIIFFQG